MFCDDNARHGWRLVRWVPPGNQWHPSTDKLSGTDEYGSPEDKTSAFSVLFHQTDFDQFLFAEDDCEKWLIATKESVVGSNFDAWYANQKRDILISSAIGEPYQALWYRRNNHVSDPWISLRDHADSLNSAGAADVLYGANKKSRVSHPGNPEKGFGVYIRKT